jgi:protoheme IX farnesyltransferase
MASLVERFRIAYPRFASGVLAYNLFVIAIGTLVRATRSGNGCGDHWPACNGELIPVAPALHTRIEYAHRLSTVVDGVLILALVAGAVVFYGWRHRTALASFAALLFTFFEAWIGKVLVQKGYVVDNESLLRGIWMSVHLGNTYLLIGALALTLWWAKGRPRLQLRGQGSVLVILAGAFLAMLLLGASGAIAALGDTLVPGRSHEQVVADSLRPDAHWALRLQVLHPVIAGSVGLWLLLVAGLVAHLRPCDSTRRWARATGWLFIGQVLVGLVNVWLKAPVAMQLIHLLLADLVWLATVALAASALGEGVERIEDRVYAPEEGMLATPATGPVRFREYVLLTKPRVISLLLFTTLTAMFVAAGGWPGAGLFMAVALGGFLSAGAANAINMVIDRDIDARMARTASRPTVTCRIPARRALAFALSLAVASFVVLWWGANLLSATMSLAGLVFYVVVYTLLLKRRTTQNIVIGGAAGCFPPLVGWTAVTGNLSGALAWYLFAIIFVWTPAHFWALALLIKDEYRKVGIPMLPSVVGDKQTIAQILLYAGITAAVSLLPVLQGLVGIVYIVAAAGLGTVLLARGLRLWRNHDRANARSMYLYSMLYLALLFLAMAVDRSVGV